MAASNRVTVCPFPSAALMEFGIVRYNEMKKFIGRISYKTLSSVRKEINAHPFGCASEDVVILFLPLSRLSYFKTLLGTAVTRCIPTFTALIQRTNSTMIIIILLYHFPHPRGTCRRVSLLAWTCHNGRGQSLGNSSH